MAPQQAIMYEGNVPGNPTSSTKYTKYSYIYIWVRFLRMGIGLELCCFKKKVWKISETKPEEQILFFQLLMRYLFTWITKKKFQVTLTPLHYTTLHNTTIYPCTLHYWSVVYKGILQCSAVRCSGVSAPQNFFLDIQVKIYLINSRKNMVCSSGLVTAIFQTFF